jgi:hypothetical protein
MSEYTGWPSAILGLLTEYEEEILVFTEMKFAVIVSEFALMRFLGLHTLWLLTDLDIYMAYVCVVCILSQPHILKQSHYMPGEALRVSGGWGSQISRQSAHEGGKVVSPTHRPPLPPRKFLVIISIRGWVDLSAIVRPEGLCQWKIPMTPSGIEPSIFRLVASTNCATSCPQSHILPAIIRTVISFLSRTGCLEIMFTLSLPIIIWEFSGNVYLQFNNVSSGMWRRVVWREVNRRFGMTGCLLVPWIWRQQVPPKRW